MTWTIVLLLVLIALVGFGIYRERKDAVHIVERSITHTVMILDELHHQINGSKSIEDEISDALDHHFGVTEEEETE